MPMIEYPKIYGPFKRHTEGPQRNQLILGDWTSPEAEFLQLSNWLWTEKVDGTNIRAHWDGHKVEFGGRTDKAQIPAKLVGWLREHLPEELFEQQFGDQEATLFGEGYGAGIQKGGGNYAPAPTFTLFDVKVGPWWLLRSGVEDVATGMGLHVVPLVLVGSVHDAIDVVGRGLKSEWGDFAAEGLVGHPTMGLLDRAGRRIALKVKATDFAKAHPEPAGESS